MGGLPGDAFVARFFPDASFGSIYEIGFGYLKAAGVRGLVADIDNTLVRPQARRPDARLRDWLQEARREGVQVVLLSNASRARVARFAEGLGVPAIAKAGKPAARGFQKALRLMGLAAGAGVRGRRPALHGRVRRAPDGHARDQDGAIHAMGGMHGHAEAPAGSVCVVALREVAQGRGAVGGRDGVRAAGRRRALGRRARGEGG